MRRFTFAFLMFFGLAGCPSDDTPAFLPFDDLCTVVAEEVCAARETCCDADAGQRDSCEGRIRDACADERAELEKEDALSYDGERADGVRDALQADLAECKPPFALARFFEGGKKEGEACERASQCVTGACVDDECGKPSSAELCDL